MTLPLIGVSLCVYYIILLPVYIMHPLLLIYCPWIMRKSRLWCKTMWPSLYLFWLLFISHPQMNELNMLRWIAWLCLVLLVISCHLCGDLISVLMAYAHILNWMALIAYILMCIFLLGLRIIFLLSLTSYLSFYLLSLYEWIVFVFAISLVLLHFYMSIWLYLTFPNMRQALSECWTYSK